MSSYPFMKFYVADWISDPNLAMCSSTTRGVWIDVLCAMHTNGSGELTGTVDQLARIGRCSSDEMRAAIAELESTKTASVTERNGIITLVSRRIARDVKARKGNALRQSRFRETQKSNEEVTPHISEVRSQKSEKDSCASVEARFPRLFGVNGFADAWSEWKSYRSEKRKPLKPTATKKQLEFLEKQPDPIACIEQAIRANWEGIFEIKSGPKPEKAEPPLRII